MRWITREAMLALPWSSPRMRELVAAALDRPGVAAVSAHQRDGGRLTAAAHPSVPPTWGDDVLAVCLTRAAPAPSPPAKAPRRPQEARSAPPPALPPAPAASAPGRPASRTAQALALLDGGSTMTEAAKAVGIGIATLSHAVKRRALPRCSHCGQTLRQGAYPRSPAGPSADAATGPSDAPSEV